MKIAAYGRGQPRYTRQTIQSGFREDNRIAQESGEPSIESLSESTTNVVGVRNVYRICSERCATNRH